MTYYPDRKLVDADGNFIIPAPRATWATHLSSLKDIDFETLKNADKSKIYLLAYFPWKNNFERVSIDNPDVDKE